MHRPRTSRYSWPALATPTTLVLLQVSFVTPSPGAPSGTLPPTVRHAPRQHSACQHSSRQPAPAPSRCPACHAPVCASCQWHTFAACRPARHPTVPHACYAIRAPRTFPHRAAAYPFGAPRHAPSPSLPLAPHPRIIFKTVGEVMTLSSPPSFCWRLLTHHRTYIICVFRRLLARFCLRLYLSPMSES